MAEQPSAVVLYKWAPGFGLPSLSVASLQVETYLRLANVPFAVQECSATSACPTGQLPALDTSTDLVGGGGREGGSAPPGTSGPLAESGVARLIVDYLKRNACDLDRGLTASQKAEAAAFGALVEARLRPALLYSTWCEGDAYARHTRPAFGAGLPFPLSYFVPRSQRKAVAQHFAGTSGDEVYQDAADALDALASKLSSNTASGGGGGDYLFGRQPCSLDALLYSCLAYLQAAPVVHPRLRHKLAAHRVLGAYVDRLAQLAFSSAVPAAADAGLDWSQQQQQGSAGQGAGDDKYSKAKSSRELDMQRKGRRWLLCAAGAIGAYVALSGTYFQLDLQALAGGEEDDEEDDGGE